MARRRSSRAGYGWKHRQAREQLLPYAYGRLCHFCQKPMLRGQKLDLDHTDDRTSYRGMTHASCNRAAGARKTNAARRAERDPKSRDW